MNVFYKRIYIHKCVIVVIANLPFLDHEFDDNTLLLKLIRVGVGTRINRDKHVLPKNTKTYLR
jgi:hypothetical protein